MRDSQQRDRTQGKVLGEAAMMHSQSAPEINLLVVSLVNFALGTNHAPVACPTQHGHLQSRSKCQEIICIFFFFCNMAANMTIFFFFTNAVFYKNPQSHQT